MIMFLKSLNGTSVSEKDMIGLVSVLEHTQNQIDELAFDVDRGNTSEKFIYLFPQDSKKSNIETIKAILGKYGVKMDVGKSRHYNKQVVRIKCDNETQHAKYREFTKLVAWYIVMYSDKKITVQPKVISVPSVVAHIHQEEK